LIPWPKILNKNNSKWLEGYFIEFRSITNKIKFFTIYLPTGQAGSFNTLKKTVL